MEAKRVRVQDARVQLTERSWVALSSDVVEYLPEELEALWSLRPETRVTFKLYGKEVTMQREQRMYGTHPYSFSGITVPSEPVIPALVQRCMEHARTAYGMDATDALVNWYADGSSYLSPHSDDETQLQGGRPIVGYTFLSKDPRPFVIRCKDKGKPFQRLDLLLQNNSCIAMGGDMQKEYTHEVPKAKAEGWRINITVRDFKS